MKVEVLGYMNAPKEYIEATFTEVTAPKKSKLTAKEIVSGIKFIVEGVAFAVSMHIWIVAMCLIGG